MTHRHRFADVDSGGPNAADPAPVFPDIARKLVLAWTWRQFVESLSFMEAISKHPQSARDLGWCSIQWAVDRVHPQALANLCGMADPYAPERWVEACVAVGLEVAVDEARTATEEQARDAALHADRHAAAGYHGPSLDEVRSWRSE